MEIQRGGFSSRIGFVAAAAGSAVGLGNIWKFPYETGENGGAAFLLVYLGFMVLIGFPVMVSEITTGRFTQSNPYGAYLKLGGRKWSYAGIFGVIGGVMFLSVYNVVAGWSFGYFLETAFGNLMNEKELGPYFSYYVANPTNNFLYSLGFMVITAVIVLGGVKKGIETAAKILMPLLFLILLGLIVYSLTLENSMAGVKYYLVPDFSLLNIRTIYSALGQAFFSLSLGMGALITYGSYISRKENIISSAALVTVADTAVAFLAGLMIFPLVFSQGQSPSEGPGLVFVALPAIFQEMGPFTGKLIGSLFFLLLCFAALTSTISLLELPTSFFVDEKKFRRRNVVIFTALVVFLIGIPSMLSQGAVDWLTSFVHYEGTTKTFFDLVFDIFGEISLPLGGFLLTYFISRKWDWDTFSREIERGNENFIGSAMHKYLYFTIKWVCPLLLGFMFVVTVLQKFFGVNLFA